MNLTPCTDCNRHIDALDDSCPFCGGQPSRAPAVPLPGRRMSRAAILAFGTSVAAGFSGVGCGSDDGGGSGGSGASSGSGGTAGTGGAAGGQGGVAGNAGNAGAAGTASTGGAYGLPPFDSGVGGAAGSAGTAGFAGGLLYGAPPPDGGK